MEQLELCQALKKAYGIWANPSPDFTGVALFSFKSGLPSLSPELISDIFSCAWILLGGLRARLWKSSGPDINTLNYYLPKAFLQFGALESGPKLGPDCVGTIVVSGRP